MAPNMTGLVPAISTLELHTTSPDDVNAIPLISASLLKKGQLIGSGTYGIVHEADLFTTEEGAAYRRTESPHFADGSPGSILRTNSNVGVGSGIITGKHYKVGSGSPSEIIGIKFSAASPTGFSPKQSPSIYNGVNPLSFSPASSSHPFCIVPVNPERPTQVAVKINQIDRRVDFIGTVRELDIMAKLNASPHPSIILLKGLIMAYSDISNIQSLHQKSRSSSPTTPNNRSPTDVHRSFRTRYGDNIPSTPRESLSVPSKRPHSGHDWDTIYYIYERGSMDGGKLINEANLSPRARIRALAQLIQGVQHLHAKGILHRDLSPGNLLWFPPSSDKERERGRRDKNTKRAQERHDMIYDPVYERGQLKICDFGLSKQQDRNAPSTPRVVSAWYRAPELCYGWPSYDKRIDVWSVGCIIYEMIARKPFICSKQDVDSHIINYILCRVPYVPSKKEIKLLSRYVSHPLAEEVFSSRRNVEELMNLSSEMKEELGWENCKSLYSVVSRLLKLLPRDRATLSDTLSSPLFDMHRYEITEVQRKYPSLPGMPSFAPIQTSLSRDDMIMTAHRISSSARHQNWYTDKVPFECLRIHDAWYEYRVRHNIPIPQDASEISLHNLVILYLVLKAINGLHIGISFRSICSSKFTTPIAMQQCQQIEREILKGIGYLILTDTPYDLLMKVLPSLGADQLRLSTVPSSTSYPITMASTNKDSSTKENPEEIRHLRQGVVNDLFIHYCTITSCSFRLSHVNYVSMEPAEIVLGFVKRRLPAAIDIFEERIQS
jgi:serine/threonine protein kinase